jgi:dihydrofolate reductase
MSAESKVILYIASSLDGYIARENGDIDWLSIAHTPNEDYGYNEFIMSVDTVIMGRKTYEKALSFGIGFPHKDKRCYVLSRSARPRDENVEFYRGDIETLIADVRRQHHGNIFLDGGAEIVHAFMSRNLIDRFVISVVPVLLGGGIPLFLPGWKETKLVLYESKVFPSGLVQSVYDRVS